MQPRIVTAYTSGGAYLPQHIDRLRAQCAEHAPDTEFICVQGKWPGWWCKIDTLLLEGPILYFDLDTSIVGDLTPLLKAVTQHDFIALRDPYETGAVFGSGIMGWRGSMKDVHDRFTAAPQQHMARCKTPKLWGDQGFISEDRPTPVFWQDIAPQQILSWKADCKEGVPAKARVIYFHGNPKPWDVGM